MSLTTTTRNASLEDLAALLKDQHARKVDIVASATNIRSEGGVIVVTGADAELSEDGVTTVDGRYLPTRVFDEGVAEKLGIPVTYVRRMRTERPDLYDSNVNGWLHGVDAAAPDTRSFLLRCFTTDDAPEGVGRAFLSDTYKRMDNFDVLTAALTGVREAGVDITIDGCDLTERRMHVRVYAPEITAMAPVLLDGYRSPFDGPNGLARAGESEIDHARRLAASEHMGYERGAEPIVAAGWRLTNSEVGNGAFSLTPWIRVKVCKNGLTITKDALRSVHLGSRMDEGVIRWSDDTEAANLSLVTKKARDAARTFLDADYLSRTVAAIEAAAGTPIDKPADDVKRLGKSFAFDEATIDGVLDHFIRGGQMTAGGVVNAITSYAQTVDDADKAADVEASALRVLELARVAG